MIRRSIPMFAVLACSLGLLTVLGGCQRSFRPAPNPLEVDRREYDRLFHASIQVLRDYGFIVARDDYRFGRVTTYPLDAATIFEPWRPQNTTARQALRSTLSHLRRTVAVSLEPKDGMDGAAEGDETVGVEAYKFHVQVMLERRQVPERRLIMASRGRRFSDLEAVPQGWSAQGIAARYWREAGRDHYLEQRLIRAIVERAMRIPDSEDEAFETFGHVH